MKRAVAITIMAACAAVHTARAQSALHFTLAPGPYSAGFRAVELSDATRTLDLPSGYRARARPLEVSLWYPAIAPASARRMRFREYTELTSVPGYLPLSSPRGQAAAERLFAQEFIRDSVRGHRELAAVTTAVRDAPPAPGTFPIVVYGASRDGMSYENSVLAEYLASYGYIVLASPSWGASGPMTPDFAGLETQARDMEYLMAYGRTLPGADGSHIGVMGDSWGGMANILVAMRNSAIGAVVTLDGSIAYWYNRRFKGGPFVNPDYLTAPVLFLKQGDPFPSMSASDRAAYGADTLFTLFDELRYTDAYLVVLETVRHANFNALSDRFPPYDHSTNSFIADTLIASRAYEQECRYVLAFLDSYLKNHREAAAVLTRAADSLGRPGRDVTIIRRHAFRPAPTVADFARVAAERGFARAPEVLSDVRARDPMYTLPEDQIDVWGKALLDSHRDAEAIGVLRLNTVLHPTSPAATFSLGQAYEASGARDLALASYEQSLALDSTNLDVRRALATLQSRRRKE